MKKSIFATLILAAGMAITTAPALSQDSEPAPVVVPDYSSPLTVISGDTEHAFTVEVAVTDAEVAQGMMYRDDMAEDVGMIFDLGSPRIPSFWMKNTRISLDLLFISPDGEVLAIAHNAAPHSLRQLTPGVPAKAVLELKGGQSAARGIEPGATVRHPVLGNAG